MTTTEYNNRLIEVLRDNPTDELLQAVARIVNSETEYGESLDLYQETSTVHTAMFGPPWTCDECGQMDNWFDECCSCDTPRPPAF